MVAAMSHEDLSDRLVIDIGKDGHAGQLEVRDADGSWYWAVRTPAGVLQDGVDLIVARGQTPDDAMRVLLLFLLSTSVSAIAEFAVHTTTWAREHNHSLRVALLDLRRG